MELDWSTFILEIINFLILVWLLKRFLYRPVLDIIARRRQTVEQAMTEAQTLRGEAEALQTQYRRRLADWEQEQTAARRALADELEAERARQLEQLRLGLEQEREKRRVLEERQLKELARRKEVAALTLAARFARRLLERLACPELEARIIAVTLEDLDKLPPERRDALHLHTATGADIVQVCSAYPVGAAGQEQIRAVLDRLLGKAHHYQFRQEPRLLAGLRISAGPCVLRANLSEELELFQEAAHDSPTPS